VLPDSRMYDVNVLLSAYAIIYQARVINTNVWYLSIP
jgi:hypothetical protein